VTFGGTSGAHLFEVARSLGVPAVIGPEIEADAGALGERGSLVAVDGDTGRVWILPVPPSAIPASSGSDTTTAGRSARVAPVPGGA
jgi:signal transduction protein with GAF and PtsI domain